MSIKIHHGPDGTFKTSGAIKDDILKIVKSGRTLVTNVRGFSKERTIEVLGENYVHEDFDVIHIDTDSTEGREHFARFFHWAPKGAFFVIDEVQRVFPPKWTEKDLRALDYPHSQDHLPEEQRRPETIHVAFDMQRHHNWDFVFTTTNIKKVHDIARVMAKSAVRHVNLGIWRFYKTVEHDAESNGKTAGSATSTNMFNYVPSKIFDLYASTSTGLHNNTEPRKPFYKDPKVLLLLLGLVGIWTYVFSKPAPLSTRKEQLNTMAIEDTETSGNVVSQKSSVPRSRPDSGHANTNVFSDPVEQDPALSYIDQFDKIYLSGFTQSSDGISVVFQAFIGSTEYQFSGEVLRDMGGSFKLFSQCLLQVKTLSTTQFVLCAPRAVPAEISPDDKFVFQAE